jgi:hypothetical protein
MMVVGMMDIKGKNFNVAAIKNECFKKNNNDYAVEEDGELKMDDKLQDEDDHGVRGRGLVWSWGGGGEKTH